MLVRGYGRGTSRHGRDDRPGSARTWLIGTYGAAGVWWNTRWFLKPAERELMAELPPIPPMPKFMTAVITATICVVIAVAVLILVFNAAA